MIKLALKQMDELIRACEKLLETHRLTTVRIGSSILVF